MSHRFTGRPAPGARGGIGVPMFSCKRCQRPLDWINGDDTELRLCAACLPHTHDGATKVLTRCPMCLHGERVHDRDHPGGRWEAGDPYTCPDCNGSGIDPMRRAALSFLLGGTTVEHKEGA